MERADGIPAQVRPPLLANRAYRRAEVYAVDGEGPKFLSGLWHDESKEFIGSGEDVCPECLGIKRQAVQARPDPFISGQNNGDEFVLTHRGGLWGRVHASNILIIN